MNETIEKIAKVIENIPDVSQTHCDIIPCVNCEFDKAGYFCGNIRAAQAIYTEIVEPLEKGIENANLEKALEIWVDRIDEAEHKAKVLERALELCCEELARWKAPDVYRDVGLEVEKEKFLKLAENKD